MDINLLVALLTRDAIKNYILLSEYEQTDRDEPTSYLERKQKGRWMFFFVQYLLYTSSVRLKEVAVIEYAQKLMQFLDVNFSQDVVENFPTALVSEKKELLPSIVEAVDSFSDEERLLIIESLFLATSCVIREDLGQYEKFLRTIASQLKCRRNDYKRFMKKYLERGV